MDWGISLIAGIVIGAIIIIIINVFCEKALKRRAIEKGWGYHSLDTGKFVWDNDDAEYVINGVSDFSDDEKPSTSVYSLKGIKIKKD